LQTHTGCDDCYKTDRCHVLRARTSPVPQPAQGIAGTTSNCIAALKDDIMDPDNHRLHYMRTMSYMTKNEPSLLLLCWQLSKQGSTS
jgi:hypothetical protein